MDVQHKMADEKSVLESSISSDKMSQAQVVLLQPNNTLTTPNKPRNGGLGVYGRYPQRIICQFCDQDVITIVRPYVGPGTHLFALIICCICACCTCLPYLNKECQDVKHYCPNCRQVVGMDRIM